MTDKGQSNNCQQDHVVEQNHRYCGFFNFMANYPWPFLVFWPMIFIFLISFGWSKDDLIEDSAFTIWTPESSKMAKFLQYVAKLRIERGNRKFEFSSFAAMAIARDGNNLFTEERLEEIRTRMEQTEKITIQYKDNMTFTWEDLCLSNGGHTYELPCDRLTPLDYFQEASWFMNYTGVDSWAPGLVPAPKQDLYRRTWYKDIIQKLLIRPLIPRYLILIENCQQTCSEIRDFRMDEESPGYSPLSLFADIDQLEMSDTCRICIEEEYYKTIAGMSTNISHTFNVLSTELERYAKIGTNDTSKQMFARDMASKLSILSSNISSNDVQDFFFYYVVRKLYATRGATVYRDMYGLLEDSILLCQQGQTIFSDLGLVCPSKTSVTLTEAEQALYNHADAGFSSVNTAGIPLPLWSKADGTGTLFGGESPVGGSGINMSSDIDSIDEYLNTSLYGMPGWTPTYGTEGFADPNSDLWDEMVQTNPIFSWFLAGLTAAPNGTSCGNGYLTGTAFGASNPYFVDIDKNTSLMAEEYSQSWCTKYTIPNTYNPGTNGNYTKQYFGRMWYDLLIASPAMLNVIEGQHDPYTWTLGTGCGYDRGGMRASYTGMTEKTILANASQDLYYIDEGVVLGLISPELLIGDSVPKIGNYSPRMPLEKIGVIQTLYATLLQPQIVRRVSNCKRPGGPLDITLDDAEKILYKWKVAMENTWTHGWDDDESGNVQFVGFFDDSGVIGTAGQMLREMTLDNNDLMTISIILIALFSVIFLFDLDFIQSRVGLTLIGVSLIVLAFFAAIGFGLLVAIKINITIAWTLPFIIIGLGVDDLYIVMQALKKQQSFTKNCFIHAMNDVVIPVTMTSIVNLAMFSILNISDIPAIYLTAQVAGYCVIALYCAVVFCFPAYCYLDMRRQAASRKDVCFCLRSNHSTSEQSKTDDFRSALLFNKFYEPILLGERKVRLVAHIIIWLIALCLFCVGSYGITQRQVGLGLEDLFPSSHQAAVWAEQRSKALASWSLSIGWTGIDYTDPDTQMTIIRQFEDVIATRHVAEIDTKQFWLADFLIWTTRLCDKNVDREDFNTLRCGHDVVFMPLDGFPSANCSSTWKLNEWGLRAKIFSDIGDSSCRRYEGGICRPGDRLHPIDKTALGSEWNSSTIFCPSIDRHGDNGWSDGQWQYCLLQWRNLTGYEGNFMFEEKHGTATDCEGEYNKDENFTWPLPVFFGPTMYTYGLYSHQDTLDMIEETRAVCDNVPIGEGHCFALSIGHAFWEQYLDIFHVLVQLGGYSTLVGFVVAFGFLFVSFWSEKRFFGVKVLRASILGALLISLTVILSLVTSVGFGILDDIPLTGFSNLSFVLSVGFAVEYSVHIVARWLRTNSNNVDSNDAESSLERVRETMSFLMIPTFMSFVSSTIGVVCLAFTAFDSYKVFFFRPLIIVMFVTYFYGCWWLPTLLTLLNHDIFNIFHDENTQQDDAKYGRSRNEIEKKNKKGRKHRPRHFSPVL